MLKYKVTKPNGFTKQSTQNTGYSTGLWKPYDKNDTLNYWEYPWLTIDPHQYSCIWVFSELLQVDIKTNLIPQLESCAQFADEMFIYEIFLNMASLCERSSFVGIVWMDVR